MEQHTRLVQVSHPGLGRRVALVQEPKLVLVPYLLKHQEQNAAQEYEKGKQAVVMFSVSMVHRPGADGEGQEDHEILKCQIFNYIDPEYGQTCQ